MKRILSLVFACGYLATKVALAETPLRLVYFETDATPPVGSPLAYDEMTWVDEPLSCRGVALIGKGDPVVLCAVDWIGIGNEGQDVWKQALAEAAETTPDRVSVNTLHQHDAPVCDFTASRILAKHDMEGELFDEDFARGVIAKASENLAKSLREPQAVTHLGIGKGLVDLVASNRRLLGSGGSVAHTRYTACKDPKLRAWPIGQIDPWVKSLCFYQDDEPLLTLTFYATHPQSYYRTGGANPDFPGMARKMREEMTSVPHIHFNGAGGDIGAGKWNDGAESNRSRLASRLAKGMREAWESMELTAIDANDLSWQALPLNLPVRDTIKPLDLLETLTAEDVTPRAKKEAAAHLAWHRRREEGKAPQLGCLGLGDARLVFGPGEMVVAYQLAAQTYAPEHFVAVAGYGDYGPGYICLTRHYSEGGYEASPRASRVAPEVESVVMSAFKLLLGRGGAR